ncbi:DUF368 domain-containing protein [Halocalculus aciditolerans]|uniref:DUF368 domain-containing protein n=1 Tax=Halocalculus aciditolerans TaxID=1383812 RepID=A0A830FC02_9EURY|nr:DUF368 domain-containing protein [Halocalculus aciditolerans]GGL59457.1 DUF368 domain-containing protein [Halocalculus aciditolerans]
MPARDLAVVYLKGACMGAADAVPGVSGGTIALITGIYERLVNAVASLDPRDVLALVPLLAAARHAEPRAELRAELLRMDVPFLTVLAVGVLSAVVTVANVVTAATAVAPGPTYAFFFGLVAASVVVLRADFTLSSPRLLGIAVAGFALAFLVSGQASGGTGTTNLLVVFLTGALAICAMVLPGISGSLILLTIGQYLVMTTAVHSLTRALFRGNLAAATDPFLVLAVFSTGALIGLLTFARVVSYAFDHYRTATLTFLIALMAGSLRAPGEQVLAETPAWTPTAVAALLAAAAVGGGLVAALDHYTNDLGY